MPSQFFRKVISLSKTPADFQNSQQLIEKSASSELASTVEDSSLVLASTVEADLSSTVEARFWCGEGADGVFTAARIREIGQAQDALTHVEEAVYDILWDPKKRTEAGEDDRLAQMGYAELSEKSRVSKRTIQSIVDRLLEKGFIQIHEAADIYHRKPTVYRVLGYGAVLRWMRSTGRCWVLRTGRGVFYARPVQTVEAGSHSTVEARSPSTVEDSSDRSRSAVEVCHRYGVSLDAASAKLIPKRCRTYDPAATDEEIAHFTEVKILQLRGSTRIGNIVGLLLTGIPEFFVAPAHEVKVYREEKSVLARDLMGGSGPHPA